MYTFVTVSAFALELFIALHFFNTLFQKRIKLLYISLVGFVLYTLFFFAYAFSDLPYEKDIILCLAISFVINFIIAVLCYKCKLKNALLAALFLAALRMATECLTIFIAVLTKNELMKNIYSNILSYASIVFFSKMALLFITNVSIAFGLHFSDKKRQNKPWFIFLLPLCLMAVLYTFWRISSLYTLTEKLQRFTLLSIAAIIASAILTFVFYGNTVKELDELYKAQSEVERVNTDTAYYAILDKQNELLKSVLHDEKNHLVAIKALANNKETDEYIDKLSGQIKDYSFFGNTKNKMLDLTVNKYQYICESEGIDFYVVIKTANLSYMENPDLISMMGNILDNAVDAAKKSTDKRIDLSINKVNDFDILTCANSCDSKPHSVGRVLPSTKPEKDFHGMGIKTIQRIAEKYNGHFEWQYNEKEKEFAVIIAFTHLRELKARLGITEEKKEKTA